jgi:hypothetical protein
MKACEYFLKFNNFNYSLCGSLIFNLLSTKIISCATLSSTLAEKQKESEPKKQRMKEQWIKSNNGNADDNILTNNLTDNLTIKVQSE